MSDQFTPQPEHKFSFGLWTVGNRGRDPFGDVVRPTLAPTDAVGLLAEVGAWGVNLHDNDLVPIDASASERDRIVKEFKAACQRHGIVVPMATVNLFYDPVFRDGAFTSNDARVRSYAVQKTLRAMDLGAELGAKTFVLWGGREGTETDATRRPDEAVKRLREAVNYLCEYSIDRKYGFRFALEAKPNEPRGDIYMATTGAYLGFIATLDRPEMVGVNPEVAHEQMAGLNFVHAVAQAWEAGKLFHIDLNDQAPGRYDQDFRFGSANPKAAFFLVKFLEDVRYDGPRHFDAHAYRTEDYDGVREFARGCMRTYLILKDRAQRWNADAEIRGLLQAAGSDHGLPALKKYSSQGRDALLAHNFDRAALAAKGLAYERLDQLTMEVLLGVR
jgi:xylose isomerase